MTRETKVGMIVAGSFLCLVCVVVASKLRQGDDPAKGGAEEQTPPMTIAALSPRQNTPPPDVKKKVEPSKAPTAPPAEPNVGGITLPPRDSSPNGKVNVPPLVVQQIDGKGQDVATPLIVPPLQPLVEKPTVQDIPKPGPTGPATLTIPPPAAPKDEPPTFPSIAVKDGPPTFPSIAAKDGPPTFPSITPTDVTPINKPFTDKDPPGSVPKDGAPTFPTLPAPKDGPPTFPSIAASKEGPPTFPTLPKDAPALIVPPLGLPTPLPGAQVNPPPSITITEPTKPGSGVMPPNPIPTIPPIGDVPSAPRVSPTPVDPFIQMKEPAATPMPIIRDTNIHVCEPGDTNFAILSQKLYGTDKFAQALLRYNRDNYKATLNGSVFLSDTPALVPGQQVHVAPVSILERDYLTVQPVSRGPIPTIPSSTTPPVLSRPLPLNPSIAAVSNPPAGSQARTYVVQNPNGESILDIAERALGDRGQWHKIWRVNPSFPPQFRIPAGTKLEIPAN